MSSKIFQKLFIIQLLLALSDPPIDLLNLTGDEPLVIIFNKFPKLAFLEIAVVLVIVEVEDLGQIQLVFHYYVLYCHEDRFLRGGEGVVRQQLGRREVVYY